MIPQEIIRSKRNKKKLSKKEINIFIEGIVSGHFSDAQIASLSMAIFLNGMDRDETIELTNSMTNSGEILSWENLPDPSLVCDKHSTGGVGDKVSLILAPILASCGLYVPMISGRGLGHTGGTLDKFDSIPGYNTQPDIGKFKEVVKNVGCAIIGQTPFLAPADKKLYSIRDIVGTVESLPLITSSILSKKIASGLSSLVLDVKVGNGSFNSTLEIAKKLAESLVSVAKGSGIKCEAILTDMNQVLGFSAGHAVEVIESINYLKNENKNIRLEKITNTLAVSLLTKTFDYSKEEALKKVLKVIENGKAAEKFEMMVASLGGDKNILSNCDKLLSGKNFIGEIIANKNGYISEIKTRDLGLCLIEIGGGRKQLNDTINYSVGITNVVSLNDKIKKGEILLRAITDNENDFKKIKDKLLNCFIINDEQIENNTIIDTIS